MKKHDTAVFEQPYRDDREGEKEDVEEQGQAD